MDADDLCAAGAQRGPLGEPISVISPWLDMLTRSREDVVSDLESQTRRRVIKSHTPRPASPSIRA